MSKTTKKAQSSVQKNSRGRIKKKIDFAVLENLCRIHCTQREICAFFRVTDKTLSARIKEEYGVNFSEYYEEFSTEGKADLKRAQWKYALAGI